MKVETKISEKLVIEPVDLTVYKRLKIGEGLRGLTLVLTVSKGLMQRVFDFVEDVSTRWQLFAMGAQADDLDAPFSKWGILVRVAASRQIRSDRIPHTEILGIFVLT